ncbi:MAG: hypothetical protein JW963_16705 [Anaerolineales bacterium]|nr:hypothetical protein [Anaerolineales bacterium]
MPQNPQSTRIDLAKLFGAVANNLGEQRETLNQADTYNNDHGDHMVEIFEVVTQAVKEKRNVSPADQLAYASEILRRRQSGSAQVYANGFAQAAQQFQGQSVTTDNAGMLLQTLLGGGQAPAQGSGGGGDMLGALLGGLTGQPSQGQGTSDGIDLGDLLNAGMAFMSAKQQGSSTAEAAINALLSDSPLGQSSHRKESGALVANTIMQVLGSMARK